MAVIDAVFKKENIELKQGDDNEITFTIIDSAGDAVDLSTGYTAKLQARVNQSDSAAVLSVTNATGLTLGDGTVKFVSNAAASAALNFSQATYELEIKKTTGNLVKTLRRGTITLRKNYAKAAV